MTMAEEKIMMPDEFELFGLRYCLNPAVKEEQERQKQERKRKRESEKCSGETSLKKKEAMEKEAAKKALM